MGLDSGPDDDYGLGEFTQTAITHCGVPRALTLLDELFDSVGEATTEIRHSLSPEPFCLARRVAAYSRSALD